MTAGNEHTYVCTKCGRTFVLRYALIPCAFPICPACEEEVL